MRYCIVSEGFAKGTAEYRDCMQQQLAALKAQGDAQKRQMLEAVAVGVAAYGEARADSSRGSGMTYSLVAQWTDRGNRMCKYGDGSVLNVGVGLCPLSIGG